MTLRVIWLFVGAAAVALAVAVRAPLATTVLGLMAFGVLHNVLELRYVSGLSPRCCLGGCCSGCSG